MIYGRATSDGEWVLDGANSGSVTDTSSGSVLYVADFYGIDQLEGRAANSDTLTARDLTNTWNINALDSTVASSGGDTIIFNGMDVLNGQSEVDTFNIGADVTSDIQGNGAGDIFNINTLVSANLFGGAGDDQFIYGASGSTQGAVDGGVDTTGDVILGHAGATTSDWFITAANAGYVESAGIKYILSNR